MKKYKENEDDTLESNETNAEKISNFVDNASEKISERLLWFLELDPRKSLLAVLFEPIKKFFKWFFRTREGKLSVTVYFIISLIAFLIDTITSFAFTNFLQPDSPAPFFSSIFSNAGQEYVCIRICGGIFVTIWTYLVVWRSLKENLTKIHFVFSILNIVIFGIDRYVLKTNFDILIIVADISIVYLAMQIYVFIKRKIGKEYVLVQYFFVILALIISSKLQIPYLVPIVASAVSFLVFKNYRLIGLILGCSVLLEVGIGAAVGTFIFLLFNEQREVEKNNISKVFTVITEIFLLAVYIANIVV